MDLPIALSTSQYDDLKIKLLEKLKTTSPDNDNELTTEYILTMLQGQKNKAGIITELNDFFENAAEIVEWIWKTMNEMANPPKSKTIDLRAIKRSTVEKKSDKEDHTPNHQKAEPDSKSIKNREVKVNKAVAKDPYPNFRITVKSEPPPHPAEPPSKKPKLTA